MLSLTIVDSEPERLASLYLLNIMNICREERFDRLTFEAAQLFDAPIALLSLVSEYRQWFKSLFGFEVDVSPAAKIKKSAFCTQVTNATLVVPDTLRDPGFAKNPLVLSAPFIRFYAGQPIMSEAGVRLGTLCVIDHQPRWPNAEQLTALGKLAIRASHELTIE